MLVQKQYREYLEYCLSGEDIEMSDEVTSNQHKLIVKLEENAMDSLVHGVEHHLYGRRNTDWKYVILHVFHAVELFLKARLAKHDESLIYRKNGNTIGSDEAINSFLQEWQKEVSLSSYPSSLDLIDNEIDSFCELCSDWINDQD